MAMCLVVLGTLVAGLGELRSADDTEAEIEKLTTEVVQAHDEIQAATNETDGVGKSVNYVMLQTNKDSHGMLQMTQQNDDTAGKLNSMGDEMKLLDIPSQNSISSSVNQVSDGEETNTDEAAALMDRLNGFKTQVDTGVTVIYNNIKTSNEACTVLHTWSQHADVTIGTQKNVVAQIVGWVNKMESNWFQIANMLCRMEKSLVGECQDLLIAEDKKMEEVLDTPSGVTKAR